NKIHFLGNDEKLLIELGDISKKAGINSKYKANFTDKSQFYSYSEKVPIR
ncbi:bacteriocin immunity protein, partial [Enterococcus faecalis]